MHSGSNRLLVLLAALGAVGMFAGCRPQPQSNTVDNGAVEQAALPALPVADPPLKRADLLLAVAQAASAAALGSSEARRDGDLDGDRFELRIRFGCSANPDGSGDERFGVRFDERTRTLRLRATQDLTAADASFAALAGDEVEAVEGFWLRRPWLLSAGCPLPSASSHAASTAPAQEVERGLSDTPAGDAAKPPPPTRQRIGIAQIFTDADARTGRRGNRAYEATKVLAAGEQPSRQGYDLVLSGRLTRLRTGHVIACRTPATDAPPDCIISVDIDRVRFEHPESRAVIAEWSN